MSDAPNKAWMFVDEDGDLLGYSRKPMHPEDYVEYIRAPDPELIERMRGWQRCVCHAPAACGKTQGQGGRAVMRGDVGKRKDRYCDGVRSGVPDGVPQNK